MPLPLLAIGTALASGLGSALGARSQKAPAQAAPINIGQVAGDSVRANVANLPDIEALIRKANEFSQGQNIALLEQAIPGYKEIAANLTNIAKKGSANPYELPEEFTQNLTRLAAERGIGTGVRGQANEFSLLRDFGINSLEYGQNQISQSQSILQNLASLGKVNPLSPLNFFVDPNAAISAAQSNRSADQAYLNASQQASNARSAAGWNALGTAAGVFGGMYGGGGTSGAGTGGSKNVML